LNEIIKRKRPKIKEHKAKIFILVNKYEPQVRNLSLTDKALVIKTNKKLTGLQWADIMVKFQLILDEAFKDV